MPESKPKSKMVRNSAWLLGLGLLLLPQAAVASEVPIGQFGGLLVVQALFIPLFLIGIIVLAIRIFLGRLHKVTKILTVLFLILGFLNVIGVIAIGDIKPGEDRTAAAVIIAVPLILSVPGLWMWRRERQAQRAAEQARSAA